MGIEQGIRGGDTLANEMKYNPYKAAGLVDGYWVSINGMEQHFATRGIFR